MPLLKYSEKYTAAGYSQTVEVRSFHESFKIRDLIPIAMSIFATVFNHKSLKTDE